jgi:hypothetical protein
VKKLRLTRETRLLVLTMVVSGVVLLLLARLRFPEPPPMVDASSAPLERLAARASFEELATRVAQFEATIAPSLVVLRLSPTDVPASRDLSDVILNRSSLLDDVRHVPALRIDATTAIAVIPPRTRITGVVGPLEQAGQAEVTAADPIRHLARVRVPQGPARPLAPLALAALRTPTYVVAVEGTRAGVTLRPIFLGRSDRFDSPRWTRPLLPLGGTVVTAGALLFTLDGEFLGSAVMDEGAPAIVGASDVLDTVTRLGTAPALADAGLAVQPLTPTVAAAAGAAQGVVVADVAVTSPAAGLLAPGDLITAIDGQPIGEPDTLLLQLGTRLAAGAVDITYVRQRQVRTARLERIVAAKAAPVDDPVILQRVPGLGSRVAELPHGSTLGLAGLDIDDLIVRAGGLPSPSPDQIRQLMTGTPSGEFVLFIVRRGDRQSVIAAPGWGNLSGGSP